MATTTSWVIRNKDTKESVLETYNPKVVSAINTAKYEAVPIKQYLYELNDSMTRYEPIASL